MPRYVYVFIFSIGNLVGWCQIQEFKNLHTFTENPLLLVYGGSAGSEIEVIDIGSNNSCIFNHGNDMSFGMVGFVVDSSFIVCGPIDNAETHCHSLELSESNATWNIYNFSMLEDRYYAAIIPLGIDQYWITGGEMPGNPNMEAVVLKSTEIFQNKSFKFGPDLVQPTHSHCMVKVNSSHFITTGGKKTGTTLDYVDIFYFGSSKNWTALPSMSFKRFGHSCGITKNHLIVTGGLYLDTTEIFLLERLEW